MTIGDDIDRTVAALDALHAPIRAKRVRDLDALANIVAGLDQPWIDDLEEPVADGRFLGVPARRPEAPRGPGGDDGRDDLTVGAAWDRIAKARLMGEARDRGSW